MKIVGNISKFYHYAFPMQAVLVTVNDQNRKTNAITIAWHTPISKKPPLYGISVGPRDILTIWLKIVKNNRIIMNIDSIFFLDSI